MRSRLEVTRTRLIAVFAPAVLLLSSCGSATSDQAQTVATAPEEVALAALDSTLQTFDSSYVQVDACPQNGTAGCSGATWAGDANLYVGDDHDRNPPTTGNPSPSNDFPTADPDITTTPTFVDWLTLVTDPAAPTSSDRFEKHFRSDFQAGTDPSAFPSSTSCVGSANVLDKMNLTYVSVSNNTQYAYFGVQRRDNNGDTGYMWMFNKLQPPSFGLETSPAPDGVLGTGGCAAAQYPLMFKVSYADVLFKGHFAPSSDDPLLSVYKVRFPITATTTVKDGNTVYTAALDTATNTYYILMPAKSAINWRIIVNPANNQSTCSDATPEFCFWRENSAYIAAAAVNTSIAGLGTLGDTANTITGGIAKVGLKTPMANGDVRKIGTGSTAQNWECTDTNGCEQDNLFAEVAVELEAFTGSSVCGATFYGSVISRSSGTTPSPDMKDLAGPYEFNFGSATATLAVTPTCGSGTSGEFKYRLTSFGGIGGTTTPTTCNWYLDSATTPFATTCNTTDVAQVASTGAHTVKLEASDGVCAAPAVTANVTLAAPPSVTASLTSGCVNYGTAAAPKVRFTYGVSTSSYGGTPSYLWSFTGGYTGSASDAGPTNVDVSVSASYTGTQITGALTLQDKRSGVAGTTCVSPTGSTATDCCLASHSSSTTPYLPLSVTLAPDYSSRVCPMTSDAIVFTPTASGGNGSYTYGFVGGCTSTTSTSCTINPTDSTFCAEETVYATVSDGSGVCAAARSIDWYYHKITEVTANTTAPATP